MKTRKPDPRKVYATDADRQTARRVRNYARGLNSQGKPYQRHPNFLNRAESYRAAVGVQLSKRRARKLATNLESYARRAQANRAAGLRVDGRPFRRHPLLQQWKQLRASMPAAPVGSWEVVER